MKIKTRLRYHLTQLRKAILKRFSKIKCSQGRGEQGTLLHRGRGCKWVAVARKENIWRLLKTQNKGFPGGAEVKASTCNVGDLGSIPGSGRFPWRRKWQPTPIFLPGESHGRRSLVGYSPRGHKESDTTERLHFHFHFTLRYFQNFYSYKIINCN